MIAVYFPSKRLGQKKYIQEACINNDCCGAWIAIKKKYNLNYNEVKQIYKLKKEEN